MAPAPESEQDWLPMRNAFWFGLVMACCTSQHEDVRPSNASGGAGNGSGTGGRSSDSPRCGDHSCQTDEDCGACPEDCGTCDGGCGQAEQLVDLEQPQVGTGCDCDLTQYDYCEGQHVVEEVSLRDGFTDAQFAWTFESDGGNVLCGRFVNGDYWVAPPTSQDVTLTAVTGNGADLGVDADPRDPETAGLLDGDNAYGNYLASEDLTTQLPVTFTSPTSLVAARQKDEARDGDCGTAAIVGACIDVYDVVTVLDHVPRNAGKNCIRPPVIGGIDKTPRCLDTDFVLERLPATPHLSASLDQLTSVTRTWRHAFDLFANVSEGGRAFRVEGLTDDYASGNAAAFYGGLAALFASDVELEDKAAALGSALAYGQDFYHGFIDPEGPQVHIPAGAGQSAGLASPAYFFASLLLDPAPAAQLAALGLTPDADSRPQELKQVQIRGGGTEPVWGDDMGSVAANAARYWAGVFAGQCYDGATGECTTTGGKKTVRDPYGYIDGPERQACGSYFYVTMGPFQSFAALQWTMPELCDVVNYDPFLRYVDRIQEHGCWAQPDPCAPPDPREVADCSPWEAQTEDPSTWRERSGCEYYTVTWGPDPTDPTRCIENDSGGNTGQTGRFPHRHGVPGDPGFSTPVLREAWTELRGDAGSCRTRSPDATLDDITLVIESGALQVSPPGYVEGGAPATHNTAFVVVRDDGTGAVRRVQSCGRIDVSSDPPGTEYEIQACDHVGLCSAPVSYTTP